MTRTERAPLSAQIAAARCLGVAWMCYGSAALVEAAARAGPDAIVIDRQHGLWERRELEAAIAAAGAIPVIVRVAENSAAAIGEALDSGAEGVMVPLIESAEEAARAVRHARFPPRGTRSGGGVRPLHDFAAYRATAQQTAVIAMIETVAGVANAASIAAVADIDMIFVGPGDLALSLGVDPGAPAHAQACAEVLGACRAAALPCGIFTANTQAALQRRREGYAMVVVAADVALVIDGFAAATASFRSA